MPPSEAVEHAARKAQPVIDRIARLGFAAKGLVAVMIGALSLRLALGRGGDIIGPEGALETYLAQPFGRAVLSVIAAGLWAHAFWKLVQAVADPERKGTGFTAVVERVAFAVTAVGYVTLGVVALKLVLGEPILGGAGMDELAARILTPRLGRWTVGTVGGIVVISGMLQLRLAAIAGFRHILRLDEMRTAERVLVVTMGRIGYAALGVVSLLIGYFLMRVAWLYDPQQAGGWSQALAFLAGLNNGHWWLGAVSAGLIGYGLYFMLLIRYRQV